MNKVTRHGVFETNSSSTHSICICREAGGVLDRLDVDSEGVCRIFPGEFGWEECKYRDATTKASYCYTYAASNQKRLKTLEAVIKRGTGAAQVRFMEVLDEFYPQGYVDHQSGPEERGACEEAFASKQALYAFIFSPKSVLVTDNDNH